MHYNYPGDIQTYYIASLKYIIFYRLSNNGNPSTNQLSYNVTSKSAFGTLACSARNEIGDQNTPCLFQIMPKGIFRTYLTIHIFNFAIGDGEINRKIIT